MPLKITCPDCGAPLVAPTEAVGRKGRCKRCGVSFTVIAPDRGAEVDDLIQLAPLSKEDELASERRAKARLDASLARQMRKDVKVASKASKMNCARDTNRAETEPESTLTDHEMAKKLIELATYFARGGLSSNNPALVNEVMEIGRALDRRGGIEEMLRLFAMIPPMQGKRTVEMQWNGIGSWRG